MSYNRDEENFDYDSEETFSATKKRSRISKKLVTRGEKGYCCYHCIIKYDVPVCKHFNLTILQNYCYHWFFSVCCVCKNYEICNDDLSNEISEYMKELHKGG